MPSRFEEYRQRRIEGVPHEQILADFERQQAAAVANADNYPDFPDAQPITDPIRVERPVGGDYDNVGTPPDLQTFDQMPVQPSSQNDNLGTPPDEPIDPLIQDTPSIDQQIADGTFQDLGTPPELPAEQNDNLGTPPELPQVPEGFAQPGRNKLDLLESEKTRELQSSKGQLYKSQIEAQTESDRERSAFNEKAYSELESLAEERDLAIQDQISSTKKEFDKYKKMDVRDYWADKPTWHKILSAISVAMGSYGAALAGGRNTALEIMNKTIDDDYRRQKQKVDKQFKAYQQSNAGVADIGQLYQRKLGSLKLKRLAGLEKLKSKIEVNSGKVKSEAAQFKADELMASLDEKIAVSKDELVKPLNDLILQNKKMTAAELAAFQKEQHRKALLLSKDKDRDLKEQIAGREKPVSRFEKWSMNEVREARKIVGFGQARSDRAAKIMQESVISVNDVVGTLDRIVELGKGITKKDRIKLAKLKTNIGLAVGKLRLTVGGPGAMTEGDVKRIEDTIGDPSVMFSTEEIQSAKLRELRGILLKNLEKQAEVLIIDYIPKSKAVQQKNTITHKVPPGFGENTGKTGIFDEKTGDLIKWLD